MVLKLGDLIVAQNLLAQEVEGETITQENVSPGAIGLVIFIALGLGTYFLWRSMNKQLKRIDFDEGVSPGDAIDVRDSARSGAAPTQADSPAGGSAPAPEDDESR